MLKLNHKTINGGDINGLNGDGARPEDCTKKYEVFY